MFRLFISDTCVCWMKQIEGTLELCERVETSAPNVISHEARDVTRVSHIATNRTTLSSSLVPRLYWRVLLRFSLLWSRVCSYGRPHVLAVAMHFVWMENTVFRPFLLSCLAALCEWQYQSEFPIKYNHWQGIQEWVYWSSFLIQYGTHDRCFFVVGRLLLIR